MKSFPAFEEDCSCRRRFSGTSEAPIQEFAETRRGCPALAGLLAPDAVWTGIQASEDHPEDDAGHRSYLVLAFERGHLDLITLPVHRYLMRGQEVRGDLTRHYRRELEERWLSVATDEIRRHQMFRQFFGRVVELRFADWLDHNRRRVCDLEAVGGPSDVTAIDSTGTAREFEVKYIGRSDAQFAQILRQLQTGASTGGIVPVRGACNYLLLRAYEAGKQLASRNQRGTAVIVIDEQTWYGFRIPLRDGWIDWQNPSFLEAEAHWNTFWEANRDRYRTIESDFSETIRLLNAIWIHCIDGYMLRPELTITLAADS